MSKMLSLLAMPFEMDEAATILGIKANQVRHALAVGRIKSSFEVRELLPTRTRFMTGWDLLEFMVTSRLCAMIPLCANIVASELLDELARAFDDDSDDFRHLSHDEIWSIADDVADGFPELQESAKCGSQGFKAMLANELSYSWRSLRTGYADLHRWFVLAN
jgi:hypothetical protein